MPAQLDIWSFIAGFGSAVMAALVAFCGIVYRTRSERESARRAVYRSKLEELSTALASFELEATELYTYFAAAVSVGVDANKHEPLRTYKELATVQTLIGLYFPKLESRLVDVVDAHNTGMQLLNSAIKAEALPECERAERSDEIKHAVKSIGRASMSLRRDGAVAARDYAP